MRLLKILLTLFALLLSSVATKADYNPNSPEEPGTLRPYRNLILVSDPKDAVLYFRGQGEYPEGTLVKVTFNKNEYYTFINWTDEEGNVVSENSEFRYTIPTRNMTLTANFTYNPSSPEEPGSPNQEGSVGVNMVAWPRFVMYDDTHVQILCETPGSTIHYTLDGTAPTTASPVYTEPVYVSSNLLVKAIACADGMEDSPIVSYQVTAYRVMAPVYTFDNRKVCISSETPDAVIRYTLDSSEPNVESDIYTEPFEPKENCYIKAYASKEGFMDSPVSIYVYRRADHPAIENDYRNRTINITHPDSLQVAVTINDNTVIMDTPATIDVTQSMISVSVVALSKDEGIRDSQPVSESIVFHRTPVIFYDGHAVNYRLADDEPHPDGAEVWACFDNNLYFSGQPDQSIEVNEFGKVSAHIESNQAFRSDNAEFVVDYFNTGRKVGARNGHRLSESFGTWGDRKDEYTYLRVIGEVEKEDLQFIATLPALTTLHLDPDVMTTESCDSVLAGTHIETIFSTVFPNGMLKGMPRLTTVMWGQLDEKMPSGRLAETENPNLLFWLTDAGNAPEDAGNIVVYDYAEEEIPTDPEGSGIYGRSDRLRFFPGYPFNAHMPVMAEYAEVTKDFTQTTEIGVCRGWETITVPFDVQHIMHESGIEIVPFENYDENDAESGPFWLYRATADDWQPAEALEAGVPYIISMPNNPEYIYHYNLNGIVTFRAENVVLGPEVSTPLTEAWKDGMLFRGTFMPVDGESVLSLNVNGEDDRLPGSTFTADADTYPFGAYVVGAGSRRAVSVFGDSSSITLPSVSSEGLTVDTSIPGTIRISSIATRRIAVSAITGATVADFRINAGESIDIGSLPGGVYIVAGMKVMVK